MGWCHEWEGGQFLGLGSLRTVIGRGEGMDMSGKTGEMNREEMTDGGLSQGGLQGTPVSTQEEGTMGRNEDVCF